ncbi:MAG: transcriptional regulator [Desulfovibrio sp.]|nr:MAG: transcriptional regulator [Desulfovibrio sp.]
MVADQESPVCATSCQVLEEHPDAIERARQAMLDHDEVNELASVFKVMGEPTRVRILSALSAGELCVCDLANLLGISQSAVSHQLRVLRSARMVRYRRQGKMVFYHLDDEHVERLMAETQDHIREGRATVRESSTETREVEAMGV